MESAANQQLLYPLQNAKIVHLVRHAQGLHNAASEKDPNALSSPEFLDAQLSPLGLLQVENLRKQMQDSGLLTKIDLVITSPLSRTMQTAIGVFRGEDMKEDVKAERADDSDSLPTVDSPPIVALELCRERMGEHPCDKRRSVSEYRPLFPSIDFSLIERDEDDQWKADVREPIEEVAHRGLEFIDWLWTRQEREIAVVTHHRFLEYTLEALATDCSDSVKTEMLKEFRNCELRSMIIVKRS